MISWYTFFVNLEKLISKKFGQVFLRFVSIIRLIFGNGDEPKIGSDVFEDL